MNIKVLTNVRADSYFLELWLRHYGGIFGRENLHVLLDGDDWEPQADLSGLSVHIARDVPEARTGRDNFTANWQSALAKRLLNAGADVVLRIDIDEFVAVDPRAGLSLPDYLGRLAPGAMCAALGLDVIQGPSDAGLDRSRPILEQRRNAILTREFCKLVAVRRPPRWASGFHRSRRVAIDIGADLLLFHLALFDRTVADRRIAERSAISQHRTEGSHISGRLDRFAELQASTALPFDDVAQRGRDQIMAAVPSPTGPHPGHITDGNAPRGYHVWLPDRMTGLLPLPG